MYDSIAPQLSALLAGFYSVLPHALVCAFSAQELELVLCGLPEVSVADWRANTDYTQCSAGNPLLAQPGMRGRNYDNAHPVVVWFWEVLESWSHEQRARLLQFVTGTARVPVEGFSALQGSGGKPKRFTITPCKRAARKYPLAHTCFNQIELPPYASKAEMGECLQAVVSMQASGRLVFTDK